MWRELIVTEEEKYCWSRVSKIGVTSDDDATLLAIAANVEYFDGLEQDHLP